MLTADENAQSTQWQKVREAIAERWPTINRDELAECENCVEDLQKFVKDRVGAKAEEIQSVIREFAPSESVVDRVSSAAERVSHAATDGLHQASESAQFAYMRADECIAKRPTESVLTSFVAGLVIGAGVTALYMRSAPPPSVWDRVRTKSWT